MAFDEEGKFGPTLTFHEILLKVNNAKDKPKKLKVLQIIWKAGRFLKEYLMDQGCSKELIGEVLKDMENIIGQANDQDKDEWKENDKNRGHGMEYEQIIMGGV